ncbi:MAG: hypothetical protein JWM68_429 [Verrucomicrobiales bacterium]|nr:hypothetical protein [Verrucomicrobiales bacterium]
MCLFFRYGPFFCLIIDLPSKLPFFPNPLDYFRHKPLHIRSSLNNHTISGVVNANKCPKPRFWENREAGENPAR